MEYTDQKDKSNSNYKKDNLFNDYEFLVQKLKSIKNIIENLEKNFLEKKKEL
tara:strand:+ start:414 stop:569 length:156 start_codon:yes stop_codon:yes gene_type:complete